MTHASDSPPSAVGARKVLFAALVEAALDQPRPTPALSDALNGALTFLKHPVRLMPQK